MDNTTTPEPQKSGQFAGAHGSATGVNWEKLAKERGEENVALSLKYHELIMEVARKYAGESRHETALRYIREAESRCDGGPACESPNDRTERPARTP